MAAPPMTASWNSSGRSYLPATSFRTFTASRHTSGPMPSPGRTAILGMEDKDRLPAVKPRIPRRLFLELAASLARGDRRSLLADTARMIAALPAPPLLSGQEHVPPGPFVLVANHYQRRDLWIGWAGSLLIQAVGRPV